MWVWVHTCKLLYVCVHVYDACTYVCSMGVVMHMCTHIHVIIYMYVFVYAYTHMCV